MSSMSQQYQLVRQKSHVINYKITSNSLQLFLHQKYSTRSQTYSGSLTLETIQNDIDCQINSLTDFIALIKKNESLKMQLQTQQQRQKQNGDQKDNEKSIRFYILTRNKKRKQVDLYKLILKKLTSVDFLGFVDKFGGIVTKCAGLGAADRLEVYDMIAQLASGLKLYYEIQHKLGNSIYLDSYFKDQMDKNIDNITRGIDQVRKQNNQLRQTLYNYQQKSKEKHKELQNILFEKIKNNEQKIIQLFEKFKPNHIKNKLEKLQSNFQQNGEYFQREIKQQQYKENDQNNANTNFNENLEKFYPVFQNMHKSSNKSSPGSYIKNLQSWIDPQFIDYKKVLINHNLLIAKQPVDILGRQIIAHRAPFNIKLKHIQQDAAIGITDSRMREQNIIRGQNFVYYTVYGFCWKGENLEKVGEGLKQGQTVSVLVDFQQGRIEWRVGGILRHGVEYGKLRDRSIQWVPLIGLGYRGDTVKVL